jgi:hypothetical protein
VAPTLSHAQGADLARELRTAEAVVMPAIGLGPAAAQEERDYCAGGEHGAEDDRDHSVQADAAIEKPRAGILAAVRLGINNA